MSARLDGSVVSIRAWFEAHGVTRQQVQALLGASTVTERRALLRQLLQMTAAEYLRAWGIP